MNLSSQNYTEKRNETIFPREIIESYKGSYRKQARPYTVFSGNVFWHIDFSVNFIHCHVYGHLQARNCGVGVEKVVEEIHKKCRSHKKISPTTMILNIERKVNVSAPSKCLLNIVFDIV